MVSHQGIMKPSLHDIPSCCDIINDHHFDGIRFDSGHVWSLILSDSHAINVTLMCHSCVIEVTSIRCHSINFGVIFTICDGTNIYTLYDIDSLMLCHVQHWLSIRHQRDSSILISYSLYQLACVFMKQLHSVTLTLWSCVILTDCQPYDTHLKQFDQ